MSAVMSLGRQVLAACGVLIGGAAATGCTVVEYERRPPPSGDYGPDGVNDPSAPGTDGSSEIAPMRAVVDSDAVLDVAGGEGMGVFVEYASGGTWMLRWTCDTNITGRPCPFSLRISTASEGFSYVDDSNVDGTATMSADNIIDIGTNTEDGVGGIELDAKPGAVLTLDAVLDDTGEPAYIFFVQDGKVNGGYAGDLSNPLELEPSSP